MYNHSNSTNPVVSMDFYESPGNIGEILNEILNNSYKSRRVHNSATFLQHSWQCQDKWWKIANKYEKLLRSRNVLRWLCRAWKMSLFSLNFVLRLLRTSCLKLKFWLLWRAWRTDDGRYLGHRPPSYGNSQVTFTYQLPSPTPCSTRASFSVHFDAHFLDETLWHAFLVHFPNQKEL